jgi:hypothetical protein
MTFDTAGERLARGLRDVRRRWFLVVWLRLVAWWLAATLTAWVAAAVVIAVANPTGTSLIALEVAVGLISIAALFTLSWQWRRRPSNLQVARYAEERVPEMEERLISAADLLDTPAPSRVQQLVLAEGARLVESLEVHRVIPGPVLRRQALAVVVALLAIGVAFHFSRPHLMRGWQTAQALWFPDTLSLEVRPGDARVVEGGALPLTVRIVGADADAWDAPVLLQATAPHLRDAAPLSRDGDTFSAVVPAGQHSFTYRVVSGTLASAEHRVTVRRQPRVDRISLRYEYPGFSGLAPHVDDEGGDVFGPAGTRVTVQVHTLDAVASGALTLAGAPVALESRGPRMLEGQFTIAADDAYRVKLDDGEGLTSQGDTEYFVRVMEDRPPDVRILRPGGDAKVTRLEEVVIEARADDDHGLSRFELVYAPRGGNERVVPLSRGGGTSATGQHTVFVEDLDVRPGDFVSYYARARDISRGKRSTETRSDIFFLEVRPFNEEFEAAQSQAGMSGAGGGEFEDLTKLQKDIVVATWRLDRRQASGAGRSAADIKAVAKSQADVKARAAQLAARMSAPPAARTRRGQTPPSPPASTPTPSGPTPMERAVEAMERAQTALESLDTTRALPHENAALNELLKAEAEVRRRQVARQNQSRGGRGGQSGNQDLSALFDQELQRQQQTNYEQRQSSTESRQDKSEDETLRRLRELAARQDQVNREQRELARRRDQVSAEEMKRRLERLTREQEELRRQAEDLARRLETTRQQSGQRSAQNQEREGGQTGEQAGQQSQSGQRSGESPSGSASGEAGGGSDSQRLREAASEMARAAGELQRESPSGASERSQRALDRLRAAERGLQGEQPDERRRAAADVQAEARQLADAERQLAQQADAAAGSGDREAVERLARQQSGLADRAEALERAASALANREAKSATDAARGSSASRTPDVTRRAARDLASERLAERMREGASSAREASRTGDAAAAARQLAAGGRALAQPLDRLAEALSQASGVDPESRRLSDALARARGLRDRLTAADRQAQSSQGQQGQRGQEGQEGQRGQRSGPGQQAQQGRQGQGDSSPASGQAGSRGEGGQGTGSAGLTGGAQGEFVRDLRQQHDLVDALRRGDASFARLWQSLESWTPSTSAPGTEPWKQDRAKWEELKKGVTAALERFEANTAARLAERDARQRLDAGADERAPDAWRRDVADYFRAIAKRPQ